MFVIQTSLLFFLLCDLLPILAEPNSVCIAANEPSYLATRCRRALRKMPSNKLIYNGDDPPSFNLPPIVRFQHHLIPKEFRSGNCIISVAKYPWNLHVSLGEFPPPPVYAASAMYFTVWPELKKGAEKIIKTCFEGQGHNRSGSLYVPCEIEGRVWKFRVAVGAVDGFSAREREWQEKMKQTAGFRKPSSSGVLRSFG